MIVASGDESRMEAMPVLPSLDLQVTLSFYRDKLGFDQILFQTETYLALRRDTLELHFWLTDDHRFCENTTVYVRGRTIDLLYDEYRRTNLDCMTEMSVRPWGMEEFHIRDPHWNLLRFGRMAPFEPSE